MKHIIVEVPRSSHGNFEEHKRTRRYEENAAYYQCRVYVKVLRGVQWTDVRVYIQICKDNSELVYNYTKRRRIKLHSVSIHPF